MWQHIKGLALPVGVVGLVGISAAQSCLSNRQTSTVPPELIELNRAVIQQQQVLTAELNNVREMASQSTSVVKQRQAQRVLNETTARFSAFDDSTYALLKDLVHQRATDIYAEVKASSDAKGSSIELELNKWIIELGHRSHALTQKHNGRIRMDQDDQEMIDTAAGQLLDQMAIAHLLEQQTYAMPPIDRVADFKGMPNTINGLADVLFELNAERTSLTDLAETVIETREEINQNGEYASTESN